MVNSLIKPIGKLLCLLILVSTLNLTDSKVFGSPISSSNINTITVPENLKDELNKDYKLEEIKGEKLRDEEALKVINKTMDTMKNIESYDSETNLISYDKFNKIESYYTSKVLVKKGHKELKQNGNISYIRNNKSYIEVNGEWKVIPVLKGYSFMDGHSFNKESINKLEVFKIDNYYVIQSKDEISTIDYYNLFHINDNSIIKPRDNVTSNQFQLKVDEKGRILEYKNMYMTNNSNYFLVVISFSKYSNYNGNQKIDFPKILDTLDKKQ